MRCPILPLTVVPGMANVQLVVVCAMHLSEVMIVRTKPVPIWTNATVTVIAMPVNAFVTHVMVVPPVLLKCVLIIVVAMLALVRTVYVFAVKVGAVNIV